MKKHLLSLVASILVTSFACAASIKGTVPTDSGRVVKSPVERLFLGAKGNEGTRPIANLSYASSAIRQFDFDADDLFASQETTLVPFSTPRPLSQNDAYHLQRAEALMMKVKAENRFVKFLDESALIDLPIGVVSEGTSEDYAVLIDSLVITPSYAYLTVYMCIPVPQSDKKLVFRGDNIRLSKSAGITGDARIFLVNDLSFKLFGTESQMMIRGGANNTNAIWDCNGFKETNIVADVEFSRNWIVPVKGDGNVSSHFETKISDWNDLVVTMNVQPFSVPSLKGVEFHSKNTIFDFSDFHTPTTIQFPPKYTSPQFVGDDRNLWRGFYMENLTIILPPEFKKQGEDARISFVGQHMLIDNRGFSGSVGVKNLFALNQGDMNGWDYSLDSLGFNFVSNDLVGAGFNGKVVMPIGEDDKPFVYTAVINPGTSYVFNVKTLEQLDFNIWSAKVKLKEGSYLDVEVINNKFKPKAVLSGSMDVYAQSDDMSLLGVQFEELQIMSEAPYLDAKAFSFGSEKLSNSLKGFPISISDIGFKKKEEDKIALNFTVHVHLTGQDDGAFKGDATFELRSKLSETKKKWKYDGVAISEVGVDIDGGSYKIKGRIKMFDDDAIYGKGFNGQAQVFFQPGFELNGTVIFGKVSNYRYWYADAFVSLPTGIPFCGFLSFFGFGGGMYHNMEQIGFSKDAKFAAGQSLSGLIYKPNNEIKYGFKATIQIGLTGAKDTFNGDATLELNFFNKGGIKSISLIGNAYLFNSQSFGDLTELSAMVEKVSQHKESYGAAEAGDIHTTSGLRPPGKDALISGHLFHKYDFSTGVFHGEMEMYVDVFGALKGIGPNGLAGWSVMHYGPEEWFIYIGTPERRVGLSVLGLMTVDGYFMLGDEIPGSPPPPPQVSRILGDIDLDYMRDENALGTGRGVALGGSFLFDTGDKKFLMFFGRFSMGTGFDVMMKNYGNEVKCKGSSRTLGVNGWYANGQAYAFVEGNIGIRFKLFGKTKKKNILSLGVAAVLQTKMPNPFWMRGIVGGRYSIMGGMIKGHCKFELEIGQECEIVDGTILSSLTVIGDVTPAHGSKDVSVFTTPQAVFNLPLGESFVLEDVDEISKEFRIKLDKFEVTDGSVVIPATLKWNSTNDVVVYENVDIFPPQKSLKAKVVISFEERTNGSWKAVQVKGTRFTEEREVPFETGTAPDYIPESNVAYSYPQNNQFNFYKDEYSKGYIKLIKGQPYLFNVADVWVQTGRVVNQEGKAIAVNFNYSNQQINFDIPGALTNSKVYAFELVNVPAEKYAGGSIDRNVFEEVATEKGSDGSINIEIRTKKAEGTIQKYSEKLLYQSFFRTSAHNTFRSKFNSLAVTQPWMTPEVGMQSIVAVGVNLSGFELFDKAELAGIKGQKPLVRLAADLDNNVWYQQDMHPLIYQGFPFIPGMRIKRRDEALGIPPKYAVSINQDAELRELTSTDLGDRNPANIASVGRVNYRLDRYMYLDYGDIIGDVADWHVRNINSSTDRVRYFLSHGYPPMRKTNYNVDITYVLPGTDIITTTIKVPVNLSGY